VVYVRPLYRYAIENLGDAAVTLVEPFYGESWSLTGGGVVFLKPRPGVFQIEISASTDERVAVYRLLPVEETDDLPEAEIPVAQFILASNSDVSSNVQSVFNQTGQSIFPDLKFFRRANGRWRTNSAWPEFTLVKVPISGTDTNCMRYNGVDYVITYVLSTGSNTDGNTPATAKLSLTGLLSDSTPRYIVLESGRHFSYPEGWQQQDFGATKIITSSIAGVPAFLTNRILASGGGLPTWTNPSGGRFECAAPNLGGVNPSCIVDFSQTDTDDRPLVAFFAASTDTFTPRCYMNSTTLVYERGNATGFDASKVYILRGGNPQKHLNYLYKMWMRDVEMWGGDPVFNGSSSTAGQANFNFLMDCAIRFGGRLPDAGDLVKLEQLGFTTFLRCELTDSAADGSDGNIKHVVLEESSAFLFCGTNPGSELVRNQASTGHRGARMISVDSEYAFTGGACIADVSLDVESTYRLTLGCFIHSSRGTSTSRYYGLVLSEPSGYNTDATTAWLLDPTWVGRFSEGNSMVLRKVAGYAVTTCWSFQQFQSWESVFPITPVVSKNFAIPSLAFRALQELPVGSKTT
jgi:hypothetical protein